MKIPAIRGNIGDWTYYISSLTFEQVSEYVEEIDDEIYESDKLNDLLQRSLTENFESIKKYILEQEEMFFNSLVLAVYDDYPDWIEVEFTYDEEEYYQMGLLEFPGDHIIIPVDGQHRVEGIKAALDEDPTLSDNKIGAIFIAHQATREGKKRTRRLFSTLNRYAKPVSTKDIIALDEDDVVAITTRRLLEDVEHPLLVGDRILYSKTKSVPVSNKKALTSIISLYQCNKEIFKTYHSENNLKPDTYGEYLRFRPEDDTIQDFLSTCKNIWDLLAENFQFLEEYVEMDIENNPAQELRNSENGGNLLFRPVGIEPFFQALKIIKDKSDLDYEEIITRFSNIDFSINEIPWRSVVWNDIEKTMIMGSKTLVKYLLIYMFNEEILTAHKLDSLRDKYAAKLNREGDIENILEDVPQLE